MLGKSGAFTLTNKNSLPVFRHASSEMVSAETNSYILTARRTPSNPAVEMVMIWLLMELKKKR